jgi:hypothetical protein
MVPLLMMVDAAPSVRTAMLFCPALGCPEVEMVPLLVMVVEVPNE